MPKQIAQRTLVLEKTTKGAVFYSDKSAPTQVGGSPITSIYLRKDQMPDQNYPAEITITITAEGE